MNIDRKWSVQFSNGTDNLTIKNVVPETRPTLVIEEDVSEQDGYKVFSPKLDENGKIISRWLPLTLKNIPYAPAFPPGDLTAHMSLYEGEKRVERWILGKVSPVFASEKITMTFTVVSYVHNEEIS